LGQRVACSNKECAAPTTCWFTGMITCWFTGMITCWFTDMMLSFESAHFIEICPRRGWTNMDVGVCVLWILGVWSKQYPSEASSVARLWAVS
jgi:hypothetical protein